MSTGSVQPGALLRVSFFVGMTALLQVGSLSEQVFGVDAPPPLMSWEMYGGRRKACSVEWYTVEGADLVPLDRLAVPSERPHRKLLRTKDEVLDTVRRLCRLVGREVRVHARCGGRDGWETVAETDEVLCQRSPGAP